MTFCHKTQNKHYFWGKIFQRWQTSPPPIVRTWRHIPRVDWVIVINSARHTPYLIRATGSRPIIDPAWESRRMPEAEEEEGPLGGRKRRIADWKNSYMYIWQELLEASFIARLSSGVSMSGWNLNRFICWTPESSFFFV